MQRGGRYGLALAAAVALLLGAGAYSFGTLYSAVGRQKALVRVEGSDTFTVKDPRAIRPAAAEYAAFAREDAAWRAANAPSVHWQSLMERPFVWEPSARQLVTDSAFMLTTAGRSREAAGVLERWIAAHPDDVDVLLDLARLHNELGEEERAIVRFRAALAIRPTVAARAELASTLLGARQYDAAAEQYRVLLRADPGSVVFHTGLAQALLWGDHGRDAERVLSALLQRMPGDSQRVHMLRDARSSFDPSAAEAIRWVDEDPSYSPYRLALARALVNEGRGRDAAVQFDVLLAQGETLALLREAAGVHGTIGDSLGNALLLGRAVSFAPDDDALRGDYARALAWSGNRLAAIEQYSVLIAHHPTADLFFTRGQLYTWGGDYDRGTRDLRAAAALAPSYDVFALLGDVYRWTGRFADARDMYARALALRPIDARVVSAMLTLRRLEVLYVASMGTVESGFSLASSYVEDNAGFLFITAGVNAGFDVDRSTVVTVGVEQRRITDRALGARGRTVYGYAVSAGARRQLGNHFALSANAGMARHALVRDVPFGGVELQLWAGRGSASLSLGTGPVYGSLMSLAALAPATNAGGGAQRARALVGRTVRAAVSMPVGRAELTVAGERLDLSDGNARNLVSATVRVPLANGIAALYDGSVMGYSQPSERYWDPNRYNTQAVGVEVSGAPAPGLTLAVRALPGVARSREQVVTSRSPADTASELALPARSVFQLNTGAEVNYRANRWELSAGAGYARGRENGYQALNGSLRVRVTW